MNWSEETPFLVIVNYHEHDVSWARELKFPYVIYHKETPEKEPFSASNKGKSATNLLKFIADFYDTLPQNIITVGEHNTKFYHDGSLVEILNDPEFETKYRASKSKGFRNFNTQVLGSVLPHYGRMVESGWWTDCMQPYFGPIEGYGDFTQGKKSYSQFVVSRERVHSLPKNFYSEMYNWIVENTLEEEEVTYDPVTLCPKYTTGWEHPNSDYHISRYMEWSWELIFSSWKSTEDISTLLPDGRSVYAIYGANNYFRDVTETVSKHCLDSDSNKIIIPETFNFNNTFSDHVYGSPKILRICVNDILTEITESRRVIL